MKKLYLGFLFFLLAGVSLNAQCTLKLDKISIDSAQGSCNHKFFKYAYSGGTPTIYKWTYGDGYSCGCVKPHTVYSKNGTYQVCGKITDANGCSDSLCISISVFCPNPCDLSEIGIFSYDSVSYTCDEIEFNTITSSNAKKIKWNFGDGDSSDSKFIVHKFRKNGTFKVRLSIQDSIGCGDTAEMTVKVDCPPVKPPCTFQITKIDTMSGADCKSKLFTIQANKNPVTVGWTFGDGGTAFTNGKSSNRTYADTGLYNLCVIALDSAQCRDTLCHWVKVSCPKKNVSIDALNDGVFDIYPNPAENILFVNSGVASEYSVYDMTQKRIFTGSLSAGNNEIIIGQLSRGTYIFRIDSDSGRFYYKLVKQ
jgi:PKD repeat protein